MVHTVPNKHVYFMDKDNAPVLTAESGDTLIYHTLDCFGGQITSEEQTVDELDWSVMNPACGPVYINGAEPGDVLKVSIQSIEVAEQGSMAVIPNQGLFADRMDHALVRITPVKDGMVHFNDKISFPINPMIGVIGVAPAGEKIPTGTPGHHGGNMDNNKITAGTVLYLPVFQPGALLAMGDLHACMGDGEICETGVEIAGTVTVTVEVLKNLTLPNPMLETKDTVYAIASELELKDAVKTAGDNMVDFVMKKTGLALDQANMLMSAVGNTEICQLVDPLITSRFGMPRAIVGGLLD